MFQDNFSEETPAVLFCKQPPPISNHLVFTFCCKSKIGACGHVQIHV